MSEIWLSRGKIVNKKTNEEFIVIELNSEYEIPIFNEDGLYDYDLGADSFSIVKTQNSILVNPGIDWKVCDWVNENGKINSGDIEKLGFTASTIYKGNEEVLLQDIVDNFDLWLNRF